MSYDDLHQACQSINTHLARYPALAVGLPLIGGFLSAVPSHRHIKNYYASLNKPSWAPPSGCFAPTWTILYLSLGYASHLVALHTSPTTLSSLRGPARTGLGYYGLSLALGFAWSPIMFWHDMIGAALVTIGGVTASSVAMSYYFFKVDELAGYLTIPYVAWLGYASALNYDVWIKNAKGPAVDKARKLGKDVNDAAKHAKHEIEDAAKKTADKVEAERK
ncbi:hypothetical protein BGX21_007391 [Mortierella sp. AD011]|nr:hypothetical protein BGX20_007557 [Mortierella sp. AD010]KAF9398708.1 hypothetical protein BGX21_007391 [Mortierella sp. AD011]